MVATTVEVWCVGLCLANGGHVYRVFDDEDEALRFAATAKHWPVTVSFWKL